MNDELLAEFKADEVAQAINQMHPTKSPSLDSMSPIFYLKYWDLVRYDVINCVLNVLNVGVLPSGLNETYICLIPKVKNPQRIIEFRPISLCNVLYKITAKVLANRLKKVIAVVIDESQSAFVSRRLIIDNVLVAFETVHCID